MNLMPIYSLVVCALAALMASCREESPSAIAHVFPLPDCNGDALGDLIVVKMPGDETEHATWGIVTTHVPLSSSSSIGFPGGRFAPRLLYNAPQSGQSNFPSIVDWPGLSKGNELRYATISCNGLSVFNPRSLLSEEFDECFGIGFNRRKPARAGRPIDSMAVCMLAKRQLNQEDVSAVVISIKNGKASILREFKFTTETPPYGRSLVMGDFVGDDQLDIAIGQSANSSAGTHSGSVSVVDGATGLQAMVTSGAVPYALCGEEVFAIQNMEIAGRDLLLVSSADFRDDREARGSLVAIDVRAGNKEVWRIVGEGMDSCIYEDCTIISDCNDDGVEDVAYIDKRDAAVRVISGSDGALLAIHHAFMGSYASVCQLAAVPEGEVPDLLCTMRGGTFRGDYESGRSREVAAVVISARNGYEKRRVFRNAIDPKEDELR